MALNYSIPMSAREELFDNLTADFKAGNKLARKFDAKILRKYVIRMVIGLLRAAVNLLVKEKMEPIYLIGTYIVFIS